MSATALLIVGCAGAPIALGAQPDRDQDRQRENQPDRDMSDHRRAQPDRTQNYNNRTQSENLKANLLHFADSDTLIGSDLMNNTGDTLGSINDFIVDRGSGRIAFAIVTSGDFMGIGGKDFAIPYEQLRYLPSTMSFRTNMTEQQVQRQTEFLPENWNDLSRTTWMDKFDGWVDNTTNYNDRDTDDRITRSMSSDRDRQEISGTITKIGSRSHDAQDHTVVWIRDDDGETHEVVLGPSWYVMGQNTTPVRGDEVTLQTVGVDNDMYAVSGELGGQKMMFRDENGKARWNSSQNTSPRYILLSNLDGKSIDMAGSTSGEVQNTVIEAPSGYVAMIGLDPNDNLFGIADTISLVPWSAIRVGPTMKVSIDANQVEIKRAPQMPDDLSTLTTYNSVSQTYTAFGVDAPQFTPRAGDMTSSRDMYDRDMNDRDRMTRKDDDKDRDRDYSKDESMKHAGDAWGRDSEMVKSFAKGNKVKIDGVYRGMTKVNAMNGAPSASALIIETDDGRQEVVLGPDWYVDRQKLNLRDGDRVTIVGKKAKINNHERIAAWTVQKGDNSWKFWNDSTPAWVN